MLEIDNKFPDTWEYKVLERAEHGKRIAYALSSLSIMPKMVLRFTFTSYATFLYLSKHPLPERRIAQLN